MKGWLDNYGKADNANDSNVSVSEDFVGLGYNTKGRNYSPAWGGQFQDGGQLIPVSPMQQIIGQAPSGVSPTVPYLKTKDPVEFYKGWIQSPEYARRQLLTGYSPSAEDESLTVPSAAASRQTRLESLQNIDPITYSTRQPSEARPGVYGIASSVNINPLDYIDTNRGMVEAHELAHIAGAMESEGTTRPGVMSAKEQEIFKKSMLPMKEPVLSGAQDSQQREASKRALEDFEHSKKPKELKADLDALRFTMYDKGIYDITKGQKFTETDFEKAKQNLGKDRVFKRLENRVGKKNFVNLMNTIAKADEEELPMAMGGMSIPGSVGFTYARTAGSAPSEGKYAKKTMPSAQDGKTTVATSSPEYKQLYENRQIGRWLDDYNFDSQVPLDEVVVEGKRPSLYQDLRGVTKTVQELAAESTGIPGAIRFSENPKENIKGLIRTGDQTGLGLLGLLPGVEQTGFNYNDQDLESAFNTLDTFGLVSGAAGLARKPIQKGLQQTGKYLTTQNPLKNTTVAKEFVPQMLEQINIDPIDDIIKNLEYGNKYRLKPEEKNFLDIIASGAESIDESLKSRIADLQSPKGRKRLIQQEKDYLQSIGFPKDDIDEQALINANARISELRNTNSINKNVDELYNKSIHVREKLQPFIDNSYLYDNAYAQVNPYNSMDNFNKSISSGSINLEKPVILGGQSLPGDIGIGMPFINSKPTEMHEIAHLLQRGRVLPIDKDARALIKPRVDLNETDAKAYKYFVKGSEKKEASAFLNELRESMYQRGIINNRLTDITPDILKKSYDEFKKNPSIHKFLERDGVTPSSLSDHRILDFMEPDDLNFSNLSNLLNRLPSATLPIAGVATISSQTIEKKKQGGVIKDNRGQWDHPGEITEIDSPYITMEGVPYPVIGKSNTGDTKLMLPGENYKFKGEKVTEYPLMQKGGRVGINDLDAQPMKKLNQLLNFTNNPDKDNWLDKYN